MPCMQTSTAPGLNPSLLPPVQISPRGENSSGGRFAQRTGTETPRLIRAGSEMHAEADG